MQAPVDRQTYIVGHEYYFMSFCLIFVLAKMNERWYP